MPRISFCKFANVFVIWTLLSCVAQSSCLIGEKSSDIGPKFLSVKTEEIEFDGIESTTLNPIEDDKNGSKPFLLPHSIKPLHYKLEIIPILFDVEDETSPHFNISKFSAPGKVWITVKCLDDSENITLHAHKEIRIDKENIRITNTQTNKTIPVENISRDNDTDFLILNLGEKLTGNSHDLYQIYIEFVAKIGDDRLNGLYLDYYIEPVTKTKRYLSTTLFAPNHARKAFPCFDEPGFKANFSIKIGRKDGTGYTSISNMPLLETTKIPAMEGWVWDIFRETIPLPTYLVALITTDFSYRRAEHNGLEIKFHAPAYLLKRTKQLNFTDSDFQKIQNPYLLQDPIAFIQSALEMWQESDLGRFPLPKVDVIALPHFFFNAMENMGAITFKFPVILNVENTTSTRELLHMNYVAGHEVVHQWFGNLLTPASWTYVWLKESFSDLIGRIFISQKLDGEFKKDDFVIGELQKALAYDSSTSTHPLENHLKSASSVGEIYTTIPYQKGASIMHMTRSFLGKKVFKKGLESLFNDKKYSNIDQYDLFDHLEEAQKESEVLKQQGLPENITITDILNTWTQQTGYPVIRFRRFSARIVLKQEEYKNGLITLLKKKSNDEELNPDGPNKFWWIPVKLCGKADGKSVKNHEVKWLPPNDQEVFVPNAESRHISSIEGYFRILYSKEELQSILKDITRPYISGQSAPFSTTSHKGSSKLKSTERSQLIDDYFSFAFSAYEDVPIKLLFNIISNILPYEGEYVVWYTFLKNMKEPYNLLQSTSYFPKLQDYLRQLLKPLYLHLQSQSSSVSTSDCDYAAALTKKMKFNRFFALISEWMCKLGDEDCQRSASQSVKSFVESGDISKIFNDQQVSFYCTAMKTVSDSDHSMLWNSFEKLYFEEFYSVQRDRYLKGLSCTRKPEFLKKLLEWTVDKSLDFHDVDRVTLINYVTHNPVGRELVLDFLDKNFDKLYKSKSVANPVTKGLEELAEYANSEEKLKQIQTFIDKHSTAMEKKKKFLKEQVRNIKLNIIWMDLFADEIAKSLDIHQLKKSSKESTCTRESDEKFENYLTKLTDW